MKRYTKKFDIFSQGFQFTIGQQFKKKTNFGGILSCSVITLLVIYLVFLLYLYFSNSILPKINVNKLTQIERTEFFPEEDFIYFETIIGSTPLSKYQLDVGKQYLEYKLFQEKYAQDGSLQSEEIPLKTCNENGIYKGYQCIDKQKYGKDISIMVDATENTQNNLALTIQRCIGKPECATIDEIDDLILNPLNYFQQFLRIQQYNTTSQQLEVSFKSQYFFFDIDLVQQTQIIIHKAKTEIQSGLFVQSSEFKEHLIGYNKIDRYFTARKLDYRQGIRGYAEFLYEMNQEVQLNKIQMPLITEVLSQFFSVLNVLMIIGIVARYLAQTDILKDVARIILRDYYTNTAVQFYKKEMNIPFEEQQDIQKRIETLNEVKKHINEQNYLQKYEKEAKISLIDRMKLAFYNKISEKKDENMNRVMYENILQEAMHQINVYQLFKDILQIKKAVKLIMSEEQYAALQFCGSIINNNNHHHQQQHESSMENNILNRSKNISDVEAHNHKIEQSEGENHLSKIDEIANSSELKNYYLHQFLSNYQNKNNITEIDRRIYNSMLLEK